MQNIYRMSTYLHPNNGVDEEQHGYKQAYVR